MMRQATAWAMLSGLGGLWLAYTLDWPAGATMVLITAAVYVIFGRILARLKKSPSGA